MQNRTAPRQFQPHFQFNKSVRFSDTEAFPAWEVGMLRSPVTNVRPPAARSIDLQSPAARSIEMKGSEIRWEQPPVSLAGSRIVVPTDSFTRFRTGGPQLNPAGRLIKGRKGGAGSFSPGGFVQNNVQKRSSINAFPVLIKRLKRFLLPERRKKATNQFKHPLQRGNPPAPPFSLISSSRRLSKGHGSIWLVVALIGLLLILISGFLWLSNRSRAEVTLFQVQRQSAAQIVGGGGLLYPRQQLNVTYPATERALDVLVHAGDAVKPGQALLRLDVSQLNAQLKLAEDNMAAAQAYFSIVSLHGTAITIAQAQQQLTLAKNKYNALMAQSAYPLMHAGNLVSPLQGVVTEVSVAPGEVLSAGAVLLVIMDESALIVHMQVPLADIGQIHVGQRAQVVPSALSTRTFPGVVSAVIPQADPRTDTFEAWITVSDSQHLLLPGMNTFVRILLPTTALMVPRLSVMTIAQLATVFLVQDQHAYLHQIQVAGARKDVLFVTSGLKAGEDIVLVGQDQLQDGQVVTVRAVEHPGEAL